MCTAVEETNVEATLIVISHIAEVTGSNPVQTRIFFQGLILATSSVVFTTARTTSIFVSSTTVHIYDFHIFTVTINLLLINCLS